MRFWRTEVRLQVVLNYSMVLTLCITDQTITLLDVIEQLAPRLQHFHTQPQIASHDSAFVGILPMDNQNLEVSAQLDSGVRFL
ncbi:hypothetical protein OEA41_009087 [Lepraria neglecta]|uniref:Uncharacterized protein n=1 Tax=Lepraria neglecta TaxID=209136 RepID=A0AAD9Z581_9LECA|nr:hypothetical protein OEA41_009087 [Lepraria neglecta]